MDITRLSEALCTILSVVVACGIIYGILPWAMVSAFATLLATPILTDERSVDFAWAIGLGEETSY